MILRKTNLNKNGANDVKYIISDLDPWQSPHSGKVVDMPSHLLNFVTYPVSLHIPELKKGAT